MEKICSKCGSGFDCQNDLGGCWCENVELTGKALEELKQSYENCLCPVCLKSFENSYNSDVNNYRREESEKSFAEKTIK